MLFKDDMHRAFYVDCIAKTKAHDDPYRKALFYTLGLTDDTRRNINRLYNFAGRGIEVSGLSDGWQTSGSMRITRLAFNLYNGFVGDTGNGSVYDPAEYSPYHLFDTSFMPYFFEAIRLRYPDYCDVR